MIKQTALNKLNNLNDLLFRWQCQSTQAYVCTEFYRVSMRDNYEIVEMEMVLQVQSSFPIRSFAVYLKNSFLLSLSYLVYKFNNS